MGFITDSLFEKVDLKSHPVFHAEPCVNRIQRRFVCTDCSDACPKQALRLESGESIRWDRCIDCGLCVTACPTRAFAPSAPRRKELMEGLKPAGAISFSCRREERSCDKRAGCLAAFPWEYLAALALYTDIVLYTGVCEACPDPARRERVQTLLGSLRDFLGEQRFASRVHLPDAGDAVPETPEAPEKQMTRRGLFSGMKKTAAKELAHAAVRRLPFLNEENEDGMQYRRMLASAVEKDLAASDAGEAEARPTYGVQLPQFNITCIGCGICEKICPQKALEFSPADEGRKTIFITPWKCTACSLCSRLCPYGGISGMHTVPVPHLRELALVRINTTS